MVGTTGGIGRLGSADTTITPEEPPTYRMQARNGSAYIQAVHAVDAVLFVERGAQKVRELTYTYSADRFIAPDMTILAEHITGDGITEIAFQNRPDPILWCIREDGVLLSFTYQRDHDVMAWGEHTTGASGEFESIDVIPGTDEDEVWALVKRTIDSNSVRYVEQFQPLDWGTDSNDCWFVDAGGTDPNSLSQLEGATVSMFADGRPVEGSTYTVSAGAISPAASGYTNTNIGLGYTSILETMPLSFATQNVDSLGRLTRVLDLRMDFYETLGAHVGRSSSYNSDLLFSDDDFATTIDPITEIKHIVYPSSPTRKPIVYVTESSPVPLTIRSISADVEVQVE
jgi:hypothetical protein